MSDRAQYTILAEDIQSQVFFRRALLAGGAKPGRIRLLPLPDGNGAGDAYVREQYPPQVRALRRAAAATGLIVQIDADSNSLAMRKAELDKALHGASIPRRTDIDRIALLVPRRNIETWIYALDSTLRVDRDVELDEVQSYPKLKGRESDCDRAARAFAEHAKKGTEPETVAQVPSLRDGLAEWRRLP